MVSVGYLETVPVFGCHAFDLVVSVGHLETVFRCVNVTLGLTSDLVVSVG